MRILLTADPMIPVPPTGYGGIERIVDALAGELRARGHTVGLVAQNGSTCPVDFFRPWPGIEVRSRWHTLRNILDLFQTYREFRPDIVHSFSRLHYLLGILPLRVAKIMSYQRQISRGQTRLAQRVARVGSLHFTGCSQFIVNQGRRDGGDWSAIPNFVDPARISFAPEVAKDAPLLFLSRVESIKGPDLAIEIARRAGRRLIIAGNVARSGPEAKYFQQKIAPHLGRNDIEWIGEVGDERKWNLLGRAAALLVPIRWDEPFGIVFAEAMACGTPVITCARGALPEIIRPGVTGYFIRDCDEGVSAVSRLGDLDRTACRRDVESRFSVGPCTESYVELYKQAACLR